MYIWQDVLSCDPHPCWYKCCILPMSSERWWTNRHTIVFTVLSDTPVIQYTSRNSVSYSSALYTVFYEVVRKTSDILPSSNSNSTSGSWETTNLVLDVAILAWSWQRVLISDLYQPLFQYAAIYRINFGFCESNISSPSSRCWILLCLENCLLLGERH